MPVETRERAKTGGTDLGPIQFMNGKRQQFNEGGSTGQRLSDPGHQAELLRSGQQKKAHATIRIDMRLQIGKEFRRPLYLIEHRPIRQSS